MGVDKYETHKKTQNYIKTINQFYKDHPALWKYDYNQKGYEWIDARNADESIFAFMRKTDNKKETLIFICNYTPMAYYSHRIGVPYLGEYEVVFHSSAVKYGGNKRITKKVYKTKNMQFSDMMYTIEVAIDGNSVMFLKKKPADKAAASKKKTTASKTAKKTTDKTERATAKKAAVKKTTATKTAAKKTSTRTNKSAK